MYKVVFFSLFDGKKMTIVVENLIDAYNIAVGMDGVILHNKAVAK